MDEKRIKHVLELARHEIIASNRASAVEYLETLRPEIDSFEGTSVWAEYRLLVAGTFAMVGDPAAETEFQEALQRAANLREPDAALEMRAHDDFARYLAVFGHHRSAARRHNESAKELAVRCAMREESAKFQLRIIKLDLEADGDPRIESFHNLKRAAKELGCSFQKQLAAWMHYVDAQQDQSGGLLAAREHGTASVGYFRGVLSSLKGL